MQGAALAGNFSSHMLKSKRSRFFLLTQPTSIVGTRIEIEEQGVAVSMRINLDNINVSVNLAQGSLWLGL
jgi:CheY-specific phosphatase CheX